MGQIVFLAETVDLQVGRNVSTSRKGIDMLLGKSKEGLWEKYYVKREEKIYFLLELCPSW